MNKAFNYVAFLLGVPFIFGAFIELFFAKEKSISFIIASLIFGGRWIQVATAPPIAC
jgi:hypothetical protein